MRNSDEESLSEVLQSSLNEMGYPFKVTPGPVITLKISISWGLFDFSIVPRESDGQVMIVVSGFPRLPMENRKKQYRRTLELINIIHGGGDVFGTFCVDNDGDEQVTNMLLWQVLIPPWCSLAADDLEKYLGSALSTINNFYPSFMLLWADLEVDPQEAYDNAIPETFGSA